MRKNEKISVFVFDLDFPKPFITIEIKTCHIYEQGHDTNKDTSALNKMASNETTIAPIPQADGEGHKGDIVHTDNHTPAESVHGDDLKRADVTPNVKGGDIASRWLASYTGPRPELTDKASEKVRLRVSSHYSQMALG